MQEELMYNSALTLREVFVEYCNHNGISINQVCRACCIPWTTLSAWVRGERGLRAKNASKIRDFLHGKYIIDERVIAAWLTDRRVDKAHLTDFKNVI